MQQFKWNNNFYFKRTVQNDTRKNRKSEYPYIPFKQTECDNKNFPIRSFRPRWVNSIKWTRKKVIEMFTRIFSKENEGFLPNLFYEARITLLPNPEKDVTKEGIRNQYLTWK